MPVLMRPNLNSHTDHCRAARLSFPCAPPVRKVGCIQIVFHNVINDTMFMLAECNEEYKSVERFIFACRVSL